MKNLMILAMLFMVTFTTSLKALATGDNENSNTPLSVSSIASGKYNLRFDSDKIEKVRVSIYNKKGAHIHTKLVRSNKGFILPYDLSNLPEDSYVVKVNNGTSNYSTIIEHKKSPAPFFKAYIKAENGTNKYNVKVVRNEMNPVHITILDKSENVIFTEEIDVDYNFEKVYDLKQHAKNAQNILVYSGANSVNFSIK